MPKEMNNARGCGKRPTAGLRRGVRISANTKMLTVSSSTIFQRGGDVECRGVNQRDNPADLRMLAGVSLIASARSIKAMPAAEYSHCIMLS